MIRIIKNYLKGPALVCAIIAPLMMLIEVFMDLQQPTLMSDIIDTGVANQNLNYVLSTGGLMLLCAVIGFFGGSSNSFFASNAAIRMSKNLRQDMFHKIQSLSCTEIDSLKTTSLITRLTNDVLQLQNMMLLLVRIMFRAPIICIGGIVMSIMLIPEFALAFAVIIPVLVACIVFALKKSMPLFMKVQQRLDKVNTVMRENLLGVRVVKSFNIENRQLDRFSQSNVSFADDSIRAQKVTFSMLPIVNFIMNLGVICVLWFGGRLVVFGDLEIGKIMAFINYLVQITHSLIMTVGLMVFISRAQASAARINELLDTEPSIKETGDNKLPEHCGVEFKNVSFCYNKTGEPVLNDISFSIQPGQTIGIIGATGSGKSTLVNLIPRLYDVTEGSVLIGGVDVRSIDLQQLRKKVSLVTQESYLFSGTIAENLCFGNKDAEENEIFAAASDSQADFIEKLDGNLKYIVEQRGRNLSGGQKQRLSIARCLLCNPDILILDDSTSAVDLATEARLRSSIAKRMSGKTVIIIAQRISAIKNADKILVLEHGRISAMGSHDELIRSSSVYRSIVVSQLGEEGLTYAAC